MKPIYIYISERNGRELFEEDNYKHENYSAKQTSSRRVDIVGKGAPYVFYFYCTFCLHWCPLAVKHPTNIMEAQWRNAEEHEREYK